jgi:MFS family permease
VLCKSSDLICGSQIGVAAPVLLILFRIMQGVAVGGESTGALTIIAESMPADRRGFWTSFTMFAGPGANVLAAGAIGLIIWQLGEAQFVAWGWRIPFLLSVILVVIGFFTRRRVEESPLFLTIADRRKQLSPAPLQEALKAYKAPMLRVLLVKASENTFLYLFSTFLLLLATGYLKFSRGDALNALLIGSAFEVFVILAAARVSDSVGRRPVLLIGLFGAIFAGFGLFTLSPGTSYLSLLIVVMVCLTFHGLIGGAMAAFFVELFPTRVRYTAMSASYQLASVAGGSIAPLVGALLLAHFGTPYSVAIYAAAVAVPAIVILLLTRERKVST